MNLENIANRFAIQGEVKEIKPLGNGLINDTYKITTDGPTAYVLQRVNNSIFKDVDLLQHNIDCATAHIRGESRYSSPTHIPSKLSIPSTPALPARPSAVSRPCLPILRSPWARPFPISTIWNSAQGSCARP